MDEKLQLLEDLQIDLHRNKAEIPSPAWHGEVLAERKKLIGNGEAIFLDWDEAKQQLRKQIDEHRHSKQS